VKGALLKEPASPSPVFPPTDSVAYYYSAPALLQRRAANLYPHRSQLRAPALTCPSRSHGLVASFLCAKPLTLRAPAYQYCIGTTPPHQAAYPWHPTTTIPGAGRLPSVVAAQGLQNRRESRAEAEHSDESPANSLQSCCVVDPQRPKRSLL
jgi:hypothetical protein